MPFTIPFTIRVKLLLVILLGNAGVIAALYFANQYAFDKSFTEYLHKSNKVKLEAIVPTFLKNYKEHQYSWIKKRSLLWDNLSREFRGQKLRKEGELPKRPKYVRDEPRGERKGPKVLGPRSNRPPKGGNKLAFKLPNGQVLMGKPFINDTTLWVEIKHPDENILLGHLGIENGLEIRTEYDALFEQQQNTLFIKISLIALLISSMLAIPFSKRLVNPIVKLRRVAKALAHGDYEARAEHRSRDELGSLARDISVLAETLMENQQSRQQWIADISHELRTPIAVIKAEIEGMIDGIITFDQKHLHSLNEEVFRLTQLVDDLHQLSMSDRGALSYKMTEIELNDLIERVFEKHEKTLDIKAFDWSIERENRVSIMGDDMRLTQLFDNLMQNTLKYTDSSEQSAGKIKVDIQRFKNKTVVLWQDSSPGVDERLLPRLFDRLYRVSSSRNRVTGGSGLGLAICESIVKAHQGHIQALPSEFNGVAVEITFNH